MARFFLRTGVFVFGSESTVMYRSSIVRETPEFLNETQLHPDTERCVEILKKWDFGFVHDVLSFLRVDNVGGTISGLVRDFKPVMLDRYIVVQRFASHFLDAQEAASLKRLVKGQYYKTLARQTIRLSPPAFWKHHRRGLASLGETLDVPYLLAHIALQLVWMLVNPVLTARGLYRFIRSRRSTPSKQAANTSQATNVAHVEAKVQP
jgi:hypothetical protein